MPATPGGRAADASWATDAWAADADLRWPAWPRAAFVVAAAGGLCWAPVALAAAALL